MKTLIALALVLSAPALAGNVHVNGYTRSNGTYVPAHNRTAPDDTPNNNYGTKGNVNPYTGANGTHPRDESKPQGEPNAGNGQGSED